MTDYLNDQRDQKTEARIQQEIVKWFRNTYCLKHHELRSIILSIPNNKNRLQREIGMMSGASDLLVIYCFQRNRGMAEPTTQYMLWIEVKTAIGVQSSTQKKFEKHIRQMGMEYHIVKSLEGFKKLLPLESKISFKEQ